MRAKCETLNYFLLLAGCLLTISPPVFAQPPDLDANDHGALLDIQEPGIRGFVLISASTGHEYRDRLLAAEPVLNISGGLAHKGFAISFWRAWEFQARGDSSEVLVGYSYKVPIVDLHAGYVLCSNDRMPGGCPDAIRLSATTNSIPNATVGTSVDIPVGSDRRSYALFWEQDVLIRPAFTASLRSGWTRTEYQNGNLDGFSIRAIAMKRLSNRVDVDLSVGHSWVSGDAAPASARDGFVATLSVVVRR